MADEWEFGAESARESDAASPCAAVLRKFADICDSLTRKRKRETTTPAREVTPGMRPH
jgi:hypothetical protein